MKAYTALHFLGRMSDEGETGNLNMSVKYEEFFNDSFILVLVLNGASPAGSIAIQLALMHGGKVLTTAASAEELLYLQNFQPSIGLMDQSTDFSLS